MLAFHYRRFLLTPLHRKRRVCDDEGDDDKTLSRLWLLSLLLARLAGAADEEESEQQPQKRGNDDLLCRFLPGVFFSAFAMMSSAGQALRCLVLSVVFGAWARVYHQAHQVGSTFWTHVSALQCWSSSQELRSLARLLRNYISRPDKRTCRTIGGAHMSRSLQVDNCCRNFGNSTREPE